MRLSAAVATAAEWRSKSAVYESCVHGVRPEARIVGLSGGAKTRWCSDYGKQQGGAQLRERKYKLRRASLPNTCNCARAE
jgi:hypothetical protein